MNPGIILFFIGGGFVLGILGYTYHQGKQSCVSHYEAQLLAAKQQALEKTAADYKKGKEVAEQLAAEAKSGQEKSDAIAEQLKIKIDNINISRPVCIDDKFLRELERIQ